MSLSINSKKTVKYTLKNNTIFKNKEGINSINKTSKIKINVAIIVPFRDLLTENNIINRTEQLNQFINYMKIYFNEYKKKPKIFIIEQSNDEYKLNRGKLLNIGFKIAVKQGFNYFIFHDVDLLPNNDLISYYIHPSNKPIHIAHVWKRYSSNPHYFGGVVSFPKKIFEKINGFPNNFWGWGGEDDELYLRIHSAKIKIGKYPLKGTFKDLENMNLIQKLDYLKENKLKCMNKQEVLAEHKTTWKINGLKNIKYKILQQNSCNKEMNNTICEHIIVQVLLNNHWTDNRANLDNVLLGK